MRIAFCSSEMVPFVKTGGLGDVSGSLPLALDRLGIEIVIFLPRYKQIDYEVHQLVKVDEHVSMAILNKKIKVYLIEQDEYFSRDGLYGDIHGDYKDNLERFQFFSLGVLETIKKLNVHVDIIHCHDWQTALIPVYLKEKYAEDAFFKNTKTILTVHNLSFQGIFPRDKREHLGLREELFSLGAAFEFYGMINLLKAGMIYSDKVSTVSKQYAKEIETEEYGCGLDGVVRSLKGGVEGIINGVDYKDWHPETDGLITKKYAQADFEEGKLLNKRYLQESLGLEPSDAPLFGVVTRLSHQKGIDLILTATQALVDEDFQLVIQGIGNKEYDQRLKKYAQDRSRKVAFLPNFDEKMAHRIYAGADFFLMPSSFEPCGLSQMISLRYGTVPIVFRTGGLIETVIPFDLDVIHGDGFAFTEYTPEAFAKVIKKAIGVFHNKSTFKGLIANAFKADFRWDKSALQYQRMYRCLLSDCQGV
ncbi:MAG: glycogen synthase [Candidatus Omnitrophica bacterium]|nr:glycogen synthase [Candidatus Omnitrophota bacterium]